MSTYICLSVEKHAYEAELEEGRVSEFGGRHAEIVEEAVAKQPRRARTARLGRERSFAA
jgi:hypothetical protein